MVTDLSLDRSDDPRIRLNFNITMMDLRCDWAVIDVVSVLGTDQNVTAHVTKWNVNADGIRQGYKGRNRNQKDIDLFDESVTETIEELHANGEDAISLDPDTLEYYKKEHDYVFVDFYASWCSHCRDLAPTWETLAEVMVDAGVQHQKNHLEDYSEQDFEAAEKVTMPVVITKIDCVDHQTLCNLEERIAAYPTLRLFVDGERWQGGDYQGHRTVIEMVEWLYHVEEQHKELLSDEEGRGEQVRTLHKAHEGTSSTAILDGTILIDRQDKKRKDTTRTPCSLKPSHSFAFHLPSSIYLTCYILTLLYNITSIGARGRLHEDAQNEATRRWHDRALTNKRRLFHEWKDEEHPGCQLQGHLLLDRTPGNFHILARSNRHDLSPHMTNVSHQIHSLSIGDPMAQIRIESGQVTVPPEVANKISPMDGNTYITEALHESYHHYLKIVSTRVDGLKIGRRDLRVYQILPNSQLALYRTDMVPEAKFSYDLSPIAVSYRKSKVHWYDYCTSIMAIIGGVFTIVGMIESSIYSTVNAARSSRR